MNGTDAQPGRLTAKVRRELLEYAVNVVYLALVFTAFTEYRRLLLDEYSIVYANYWVGLIGALILGKVVMIGGVFRLGRWLESKPLIVPTVYKALLFSGCVLLLRVVEYSIRGLVRGDSLSAALNEFFTQKGVDEVLANLLAVFVTLLPFFAVKELGRVLGRERIADLFFRARPDG